MSTLESLICIAAAGAVSLPVILWMDRRERRAECARWARWRCPTCGNAFGVDAAARARKDKYSGWTGDVVFLHCATCGDVIFWVREDGTPASSGAVA